MKKIAIFMMAAMVSLASCDILDNKPYDTYTKDNFFTSEANVELFTNYFYSEFGGASDFYFNKLNDDQAVTGLASWTFLQVPATASAWNSPYNQIRRCNLLLENVPNVPKMSDLDKNHYLGVARLFRAWHHYKLVRGFGDCFWVDHVLDPAEGNILYGPRNDRDSVMDKILEDLNFAVANISKNGSSRTQINVWVAQAMKAEICLYEASFCKYRVEADGQKAPDAARAEKYYRECCAACEEIIYNSNGNFSLTPKYADLYNSLNLTNNSEMILVKHYAYPSLGHSLIDYTCGSTQVDGINKACFNSYLSADGELMTYGDDHGELIDGKPSMAKQIAKRDPRLAVHMDALLQYKGNSVIRYENMACKDKDNNVTYPFKNCAASTSSTGYGVLKFDTYVKVAAEETLIAQKNAAADRQQIGRNDTDAPIFWYAVILLNYAEAKAELGEFDAAVQAKTLDAIRGRAGMIWGFDYSFHDPANTIGVSDLIWEIRRERRIELMFDKNDRYYSLLRWHQLDKLDTQKYPEQTKGAWIAGFVDDITKCDGATYPQVDENGYIDTHNGAADRIFDNKYYLFPVPADQLMLNKAMKQNPGW